MPDKAAGHIEGILDAHAIYCGLPGVRFLCTSADVLSRLVWVSAGVPRDALNLFAQAMTKGTTEAGVWYLLRTSTLQHPRWSARSSEIWR